jgi:hypothetical protein
MSPIFSSGLRSLLPMRPLEISGYRRPEKVDAGPSPVLQWLSISDLVVDPSYRQANSGSIRARAKRTIASIARSFSWSRFGTVIVARTQGGKFVIIDGKLRTTAAALLGFKEVPCQIVAASPDEQALAFKVINATMRTNSRLAMHAAGVITRDPSSLRVAEICTNAGVELLPYPVSADRQSAGQTMAIEAISKCLTRYGEDTLVAALQCVTRTNNNKPGALSARLIKALCAVLAGDPDLRDSSPALLETFDRIDLVKLDEQATAEAAAKKLKPLQVLIATLRNEIAGVFSKNDSKRI